MKYYLLSLKWSKGKGTYTWWGPDSSGYTDDIDSAGVYEIDGEVPVKWMNESVVAIPAETVEKLITRKVVPSYSENWRMFNIDLEKLPHY